MPSKGPDKTSSGDPREGNAGNVQPKVLLRYVTKRDALPRLQKALELLLAGLVSSGESVTEGHEADREEAREEEETDGTGA